MACSLAIDRPTGNAADAIRGSLNLSALSAMTRRPTRSDASFAVVAIVLAVGSFLLLLVPGIHLWIMAPALDLALDTGALVVTGCVATLAWMRYSERKDDHAAYQAAAFLALAFANVAAVGSTLLQHADSTLAAAEPNADQLVIFLAAHLLCGLFMVAGAFFALRKPVKHRPALPLVAAAVTMLATIGLVSTGAQLPALVTLPTDGGVPSLTPLGILASLVAAALFAVSALLYHRIGKRDSNIGDRYIAIGLLIGSFALIQSAVYPETHPGPVSTVSLLWLAVNLVLLLAIEAEAQSMLAATRAANRSLMELREVEVERAALEERARLSRELHDGLAQELWLAKLKAGRLATVTPAGSEQAALVGELVTAIDTGLADARQAVSALRVGPADDHTTLCDLMRRHVDDFADRFGIRAEFECDNQVPRMGPRAEAEVLRIAQEALNNVRRHADATLVRVRLEGHEDTLLLTVRDNGRGFDHEAVAGQGIGLSSMRERAALINAQLGVVSRSQDGTAVTLEVPVPEGVTAGQAAR